MLTTTKEKSFAPKGAEKPIAPADPLGARFCQYFNHPWGFIYAPAIQTEKPHWQTETRYPLQPRNLWQQYQNPKTFLGLRFGKNTRYFAIDIDLNSVYHPAHDPTAYKSVLGALEEIGLCKPVAVTSSDSGGIHVYYFFGEELPTFPLACACFDALTEAGLEIKQGQLEIFPNLKAWTALPSNYNALRLPLQAGSFLLDESMEPYTNDLNSFLDAADWSAAGQDYFTLKLAIKAASLRQQKLYKPTNSIKAELWRLDLKQRIAQGWTDYGQTNSLLKDIACYGIVFKKLADDALVEYILETALTSPGYREYCRHQHNIEQRAREWAYCCMGFYTPYPSIPNRQRNYRSHFGAANNIVDFPHSNLNKEKQLNTQERIRNIVAHLEQAGELPLTPAIRVTAIIATSKQLYGVGVSKTTLHKPEYLALWHPRNYQTDAQRCVQPQPEPVSADLIPPKYPQIPDPWLEPEPPQPAPSQGQSNLYTPLPIMKVLCLPPAKEDLQPHSPESEANSKNSLNSSNSLPTESNSRSDKNYKSPTKGGAAEKLHKPDLSIDASGIVNATAIVAPEQQQEQSTSQQRSESKGESMSLAVTGENSRLLSDGAADTQTIRRLIKIRLIAIQHAKKAVQSQSGIEGRRFSPQEREQRETVAKMRFLWESGEPSLMDEVLAWARANPDSGGIVIAPHPVTMLITAPTTYFGIKPRCL